MYKCFYGRRSWCENRHPPIAIWNKQVGVCFCVKIGAHKNIFITGSRLLLWRNICFASRSAHLYRALILNWSWSSSRTKTMHSHKANIDPVRSNGFWFDRFNIRFMGMHWFDSALSENCFYGAMLQIQNNLNRKQRLKTKFWQTPFSTRFDRTSQGKDRRLKIAFVVKQTNSSKIAFVESPRSCIKRQDLDQRSSSKRPQSNALHKGNFNLKIVFTGVYIFQKDGKTTSR